MTSTPSTDPLSQVAAIFSKSAGSMPIHQDLPRLAPFMSIIDDKGNAIASKWALPAAKAREATNVEQIRAVILRLNAALEGDASSAKLAEEFDKERWRPDFMTDTLKEFLAKCSGCKFVGVLKACTQSILMPVVMELKTVIPFESDFSTKDAKDGWRIYVEVWAKSVKVVHYRKETAMDSDPSNAFDMQWELALSLDEACGKLTDTRLSIFEPKAGKNMSDDRRKQLDETLAPLLSRYPGDKKGSSHYKARKANRRDGEGGSARGRSPVRGRKVFDPTKGSGSAKSRNASAASRGSARSLASAGEFKLDPIPVSPPSSSSKARSKSRKDRT